MTGAMLPRLVELWLRVPRLLRWCVPASGMAVLWWSSSKQPGDDLPSFGGALFHNSMHVVAYACIGGSAWLAWSKSPVARPHRLRSCGAWAIATAYGVVDEVHQSFVPDRDCSLFDLVSDAAGAALAIALLRGLLGVSARWRVEAALAGGAALLGVLAATYLS